MSAYLSPSSRRTSSTRQADLSALKEPVDQMTHPRYRGHSSVRPDHQPQRLLRLPHLFRQGLPGTGRDF